MAENILEENANSTFLQCISYIKSNEIDKAISKAQFFIEKCKNVIITERDTSCFEFANEALFLGIFFRGIQNFAHLKQMTVSSDWMKNPELIEPVWVEMWDCKERLEYTSPLIKMAGLEWIFNDINSLYQDFYQNFGHGLYVSPGFMVEKTTCNICGQDTRACEHISGMIYSSKVCGEIPRGIIGDHTLITDHPDDPRCRIWPHNQKREFTEKEGSAYEVHLLSFFMLDDFMYNFESK